MGSHKSVSSSPAEHRALADGGHEWVWDSRCSGQEGRQPILLLAGAVITVGSTAAGRHLGMLPPPGEWGSFAKPRWDPDSAPLPFPGLGGGGGCSTHVRQHGCPTPNAPAAQADARSIAPAGGEDGVQMERGGKHLKTSPACVVGAYRQLPAICLPEEGGTGPRRWPTGGGLPLRSPQLVL